MAILENQRELTMFIFIFGISLAATRHEPQAFYKE